MSGLKADSQRGPSQYLKSKGAAEDLHPRRECAAGDPEYVIFQPSVVFGPGDAFINQFAGDPEDHAGHAAACLRRRPVRAGLRRRRGRGVRRAASTATTPRAGRSSSADPRSITLGDIVRLTAATLGLRRWVLPLPRAVSRMQAAVMDYVPGKPFSTDNFLSATLDSVVRLRRARGTRHRAHVDARRAAASTCGRTRTQLTRAATRPGGAEVCVIAAAHGGVARGRRQRVPGPPRARRTPAATPPPRARAAARARSPVGRHCCQAARC